MTARARRDEAPRREVTINLRASAQTRELIDRAARAVGKTRSEFMLDSARHHAENVLLDQKLFVLDADRYARFLKLLDARPKPPAELRKLLAARAPWEK